MKNKNSKTEKKNETYKLDEEDCDFIDQRLTEEENKAINRAFAEVEDKVKDPKNSDNED